MRRRGAATAPRAWTDTLEDRWGLALNHTLSVGCWVLFQWTLVAAWMAATMPRGPGARRRGPSMWIAPTLLAVGVAVWTHVGPFGSGWEAEALPVAVAAVGVLAIVLWVAGALSARRPVVPAVVTTLVVMVWTACLGIAWNASGRPSAPPAPPPWLSGLRVGAVLSGAWLLWSALKGAATGSGAERVWRSEVVRDLFRARAWRLLSATLARTLALGASLTIACRFDPIGPPYFIEALISATSSTLAIRVLIGLVFPLLIGLLAVAAPSGDGASARRQFMPAVVLIALGEILAAGLSVAMGGLAF